MSATPKGFIDSLPVYDFFDEIVAAVDQNQVTIITAETGAGKSTQIPQYLAEHGYTKVVVTQPRILAARNLSNRVREEWAERTSQVSEMLIGYRTAHERDDNPETQILYCTDGLQLVREITGLGVNFMQVLVLDEVHEWNENMEVLVAWAKKRCQEDPHFKVVIMSATIETESLAEYFDTTAVINIPGRSFEVVKRRGTNVISEIMEQLATKKSNTLVFLPGKSEIQYVSDAIMRKANEMHVPVLALHSQLEATDQQAAFDHYPNGKVVLATNIAQTSVTIDDIDVVIDSGLERRSEVRSGVEGLFIVQASQADCLQRAGRAGRTKAGEYILAPYDVMPCLEFDEREPYTTPEILRKHIDRLTLRLANIGIDIESLDFYHDPSRRAIVRAKQTLLALGALTRSGGITNIGRQMEQFPVESSYGRMLVEAAKYPHSVQAKLAAIIGIQEVGGIVKGGVRHSGWRKYTKQTKSDLLAQYDVYLALKNIVPEEYEDLGIIGKNIDKASDTMERLCHDLGLPNDPVAAITVEEQDQLLQCIVAGQIDQLWVIDEYGKAVHITTKTKRELSSSTVVRNAKLIAGTPFDLQIPTRSGGMETLHLVQAVTAVNTDWLLQLAPQQFAFRRGKVFYDPHMGSLASRQLVRFGGQLLEGSSTPVTDNTPQNRRLFNDSYAEWAYSQLERERRQLSSHHKRRIPEVPLRVIQKHVKAIAGNAISLNELSSQQRQTLIHLATLQAHLGSDFMTKIAQSHHAAPRPEKRFRGWNPRHKRN